jgi:sugar/nucleoside kinase (ribokinase family)
MPLDFLAIGHVSRDIVPGEPEGWRLGGTVAFAATLARRLGLRAGIITSAGPDLPLAALLPDIEVCAIPASESTQFENRYEGGRRTQWLRGRARPIEPCHIPPDWRDARLVLVGPIIDEVGRDVPHAFPQAMMGICLQGWLRRVDKHDRVRPAPATELHPAVDYPTATALFLSSEDLGAEPDPDRVLATWTCGSPPGPLVAYTRNDQGAQIWADGSARQIAPFPSQEVDATGAGDVFATAFLIALSESGDIDRAARFAGAAAALSVRSGGLASVPDRQSIQQMLDDHPEVRLQ